MNGDFSVSVQLDRPVPAGRLRLSRSRGRTVSLFRYDGSWLRDPRRFPLSPDLPLREEPAVTGGLFGCFQDCSPDRWGRRLLSRRETISAARGGRSPRLLQDPDFLLMVSDPVRQGAIRLSCGEGLSYLASDGAAAPPVLLQRLLAASDRLAAGRKKEEDIHLLASYGASLGGARPKACVLDGDGLWIAKFPGGNDGRDIPLWEYVNHRLARRAGLRTPEVRLLPVAGRNVLLVRRFDRQGRQRIPFLSAMTLLGEKDGGRGSYAGIAAALQAHGSSPGKDLPELWSRMVFNMLVCNTDDHLRNHGFLREAGGWRLSPVFDLETSLPGEKEPQPCTEMYDGAEGFSLSEALEAAVFFSLDLTEAKRRLSEIRRAVSAWRLEAGSVRAGQQEMRLMAEAYEYQESGQTPAPRG